MQVLFEQPLIMSTRSSWHRQQANVLVTDGKINRISKEEIIATDAIKVRGEKLILNPGWVDMRSHFSDPGEEHKEDLDSGARAAAAGGFTEVLVMPNTYPLVQDKSNIYYILSGNSTRVAKLLPCAAVTRKTEGNELNEMLDLNQAGAIAFSDGLKPLWNPYILMKTLLYLQKIDGLLIDFAEDKWLSMFGVMHEGIQSTMLGMKGIPSTAEEITVQRNLKLLEYSGGKIHLACVSTKGTVELIKQAKIQGMNVSCDVAAANLVYDDTSLEDFDNNFKVKPVLRGAEHREALIAGLKEGTIDAISSNHVPQDEDAKKVEFDAAEFGMSGIQTVLPMLLSLGNEIPLDLLSEKLSYAPRKILKRPEARIEEGAEAFITAFDTEKTWTLNAKTNLSKSRNSPLFNQNLKGKVLATINGTQYYVQN